MALPALPPLNYASSTIISINDDLGFQRHTDAQQVHEKVFNVTNHQGKCNENTMKDHLTSISLCVEGIWKLEENGGKESRIHYISFRSEMLRMAIGSKSEISEEA